VPERASGAGVQSVDLIRTGYKHHAVDHHGSDFQHIVSDRKHPFQGQVLYVGGVDLIERAVAVAADVSVIGGPVAGPQPILCREASDPLGPEGCSWIETVDATVAREIDAAVEIFGQRANGIAGKTA